MRPKRKIDSAVILPLICIIAAFAFLFLFDFSKAEKLIYICTSLSVPESLPEVCEEAFGELSSRTLEFFGLGGDILFQQKSGEDAKEEIVSPYPNDIFTTPDDILKNMSRVEQQFSDGIYTNDGDVSEQTLTEFQATDILGNVAVRNTTKTKEIDIDGILASGCKLPVIGDGEPAVLIYHTHSTESYVMIDDGKFSSSFPSRNENKDVNMIRVGDEICRVLEQKGIAVIHDREIHDRTYTGAYDVSRQSVTKLLEENPTVFITLDIHRDAVYLSGKERLKPTVDVNGKKAAQMMIIAGAEDGNVENFPNWEQNLAFGINLQKAVNDKYENLMKPVFFCCRKYNMDLTPYSLLIEVGTDVNTLEEAAYSGRLLADVLADYINTNSAEEK